MRVWLIGLAAALFTQTAAAQETQISFVPYSAYVAAERGLHVREEPSPQSPVLATLWQGARVFVREANDEYVRIDGYGVAGYAFVDSSFLTLEPVLSEPANLQTETAQTPR